MEEAGEGGGAGGVGRPLAKSDFAKRQPRLFCSAFPPAAQAGGQAGRLAESLTEAAAPRRQQEWLANFLQLILRRHWPETKHHRA